MANLVTCFVCENFLPDQPPRPPKVPMRSPLIRVPPGKLPEQLPPSSQETPEIVPVPEPMLPEMPPPLLPENRTEA